MAFWDWENAFEVAKTEKRLRMQLRMVRGLMVPQG